jgi:hypothetical protein
MNKNINPYTYKVCDPGYTYNIYKEGEYYTKCYTSSEDYVRRYCEGLNQKAGAGSSQEGK